MAKAVEANDEYGNDFEFDAFISYASENQGKLVHVLATCQE